MPNFNLGSYKVNNDVLVFFLHSLNSVASPWVRAVINVEKFRKYAKYAPYLVVAKYVA